VGLGVAGSFKRSGRWLVSESCQNRPRVRTISPRIRHSSEIKGPRSVHSTFREVP
jgi:hypothetical protein